MVSCVLGPHVYRLRVAVAVPILKASKSWIDVMRDIGPLGGCVAATRIKRIVCKRKYTGNNRLWSVVNADMGRAL